MKLKSVKHLLLISISGFLAAGVQLPIKKCGIYLVRARPLKNNQNQILLKVNEGTHVDFEFLVKSNRGYKLNRLLGKNVETVVRLEKPLLSLSSSERVKLLKRPTQSALPPKIELLEEKSCKL